MLTTTISRLGATLILAAATCAVSAQQHIPVEKLGAEREQAVTSAQYRAGRAYRQLEDARHQARLAEQDVLNLEDAYQRRMRETEELKRRLEGANQALAEARANETAARQAYEKALQDVDAARGTGPGK